LQANIAKNFADSLSMMVYLLGLRY